MKGNHASQRNSVCYHLYNRGAFRNRVFHSRHEYGLFLRKWREHVSAEQICIIAYCLMPNHYHLLVRAEDESFSDHMRRFGTLFVKSWNRLRQTTGVVFEGPFQAIHIDREEYLLHLSRYIHRNPIIAGLVSAAEDWEFSSYQEYIMHRQGTLPEKETVLKCFTGPEDYRRFVELAPFDGSIRHLLFIEED